MNSINETIKSTYSRPTRSTAPSVSRLLVSPSPLWIPLESAGCHRYGTITLWDYVPVTPSHPTLCHGRGAFISLRCMHVGAPISRYPLYNSNTCPPSALSATLKGCRHGSPHVCPSTAYVIISEYRGHLKRLICGPDRRRTEWPHRAGDSRSLTW